MKRSEIKPAAEAYLRTHPQYLRTHVNCWADAMTKMALCVANGEYKIPHFTPHPPQSLDAPVFEHWPEEAVAMLFHFFWDFLPESTSIHGPAFMALCDIAENIFGFDDDDDLMDIALAN